MEFDYKLLDRSYLSCENIMKAASKSFYAGFSRLSYPSFRHVAAIYAFCRRADDISDEGESIGIAKKRLDSLEGLLGIFYERDDFPMDLLKDSDLFWTYGFFHTIKTQAIKKDHFLMQLCGQRADLDFKEIKTKDDLVAYSKKVAGSVGLMLKPILVDNDKEGLDTACLKLGVGMQITNILRDIGEDIRKRDRIYLPSDLLKKYGVKKEDLIDLAYSKEAKISDSIKDMWEELSDLSDFYYKEIFSYIGCFKKEARLPLIASALIYKEIENEVRKSGYDAFTKRSYTSKAKRLKLLKKAKDLVSKGGEK